MTSISVSGYILTMAILGFNPTKSKNKKQAANKGKKAEQNKQSAAQNQKQKQKAEAKKKSGGCEFC